MEDEESRTVWVGNFDPNDVTEEILYELFLQAGPLYYVKIPTDKSTGREKNFGFVCFRHSISVPYAIELLNGISLHGRNIKVQSRNHPNMQSSGISMSVAAGGIHSLDPTFGQVRRPPGPTQPCGQQALLHIPCQQQGPSLLGMPANNMMQLGQQHMTFAQQQMLLLNAFQPIPLSANPLLNAHRQQNSDRHGSLNYNRNSPYQRGNQYDQRSNYSNYQYQSHNSHGSRRNTRDKYGDMQHYQDRFDYNRLGPTAGRDHNNDHHKRRDDSYERHRSGSHHSSHSNSRSDNYKERHYSDRHSSRSYRH